MPNTVIQLKKSATPSSVPSDLANGELAINFADGKLFYKNTAGFIAEFSGAVNSFGTVNANGTLVVSDTSGDVLTLLAGNNITIVGDAVNDRVTIGLSNDITVPGVLYMQAVGGDEGGQIELANAVTNSTLSGNVVVDIYQNKLRFYEKGSPNKGAFIDLSIAGSGVSTNLLATSGGTTDATARATAEAAFAKANNALANTTGTFAGDLTIAGNLVTTGNVTLGDASTDTITINGSSISLGNNQNIDGGTLFIDATNNRVGIGNSSPSTKLFVDGSFRFATDGNGANWLDFSRTGSNVWRLDTSGVGTLMSISGNQITFPQDVVIQRAGLTITPTTTTSSALTVNHSTTTNNSININLTPTWNGSGNTFTGYGINVTNIACNTVTSGFFHARANGNSAFRVDLAGDLYFREGFGDYQGYKITNSYDSTVFSGITNGFRRFTFSNAITFGMSNIDTQSRGDAALGWTSDTNSQGTMDIAFYKDAANTIGIRGGSLASGKGLRLYGAYTDASNYERINFLANTTGHYIIGEEGGTGSARPLYLGSNNTIAATIDTASRIGIGTTSPAAQFHLSTLGANSYSTQLFRVTSNTGARIATVTGDGRFFVGSDNGYNVVFSVDNKGEKRDSSYTMLIRDANNMLMSSTGFVTDATNFNFGANNFGATIEFVSPAGNGMLRNNRANTTIGQGSQAGTPDKTLRVWSALTNFPTALRVRESDWQGTQESFGVYANNDTTPRLVVANGFVGINTSSPTSNLHVIGNANITTSLTVAGTDVIPAIQAAYNNANTKLATTGGTINGDLTIVGNLSLSGNTVFTNAATLVISDPLIYLAGNNYVSDIVDIGFIANYSNSTGQNVHTGLFRDHTTKEYYLFHSYDQEPINNHIDPTGNNLTLAVLNSAVRTSNLVLGGANLLTTLAGSNAAVGTGANAFASATIAGSNTAVGTGANTVGSAAFAKANAALANATGTFAGTLTVSGSLSTTGNIGIGRTDPGFRLDVVGTINASNVLINGNSIGAGGGASVAISDSAPTSPSANSLWWSSDLGKLFIYYNDGSSNQWVETSPSPDTTEIFNTANSARDIAILSFNRANTTASGFDTANAAFARANSAQTIAIASFAKANTAVSTGKAIAMAIVFG